MSHQNWWIKVRKSLLTDMRAKRVAAGLRDRCEPAGINPLTVVVGGLAQLWLYGDSFAGDDDILFISVDEVDEITGIKGFAKLLPADWLVVIDAESVKLPGFHAHNGPDARKREQTAKRVAQHRYKTQRNSVSVRNAPALQTPPTPHPEAPSNAPALHRRGEERRTDEKRGTPPESIGAVPSTAPRALQPPEASDSRMATLHAAYPRRAGGQRWPEAEKAIRARLREGHTWGELMEGTARYALFLRATGKDGTEYVQQAATFFGTGKGFAELWAAPPTKGDKRLEGNLAAAAEAKRQLMEEAK